MQGLLVLGFASGQTEIFLDVVNASFNNCPDFISGISFRSSANGSGIRAKILFWVNINHSSAFRGSTRIVAETLTGTLFCVRVGNPFHLGTNKLMGWQSAPQVRLAALRPHWKRGIARATRNAVPFNNVILILDFDLSFSGINAF